MTSKAYVALRVPADPMRAFHVFTRDIALWWRPGALFQITPHGDGTLAFEPCAGGRLFTTLASGKEFDIGRISVWEPGERLVFTWRQATFRHDQETEVEVRFEGIDGETRVSVEHRAWDSIPQGHVARHGFPESTTLQHAASWWRTSLDAFQERFVR